MTTYSIRESVRLAPDEKFNSQEKKQLEALMTKKYQIGRFLQGLAHELDQDARCSEMLRATSVKRPPQSSKYNSVPLELIHYSKIVTEDPSEKHYLCVVMLCRNDRPTFHIVHISTGQELRENLDVFLGNIG